MQQRNDSANRELPFEPEPKIEKNSHRGDGERDDRGLQQLLGNDGSHHLGAAQIDILSKRTLDLADRFLLRRFAARLLLHTDHQIVGRAELLDLDVA